MCEEENIKNALNGEMTNKEDKTLQITYFGHSFFKVSSDGLSATFDPVDEGSGFVFNEKIETNLSLVSHMHHDHCNEEILEIYKTPGFDKDSNVRTLHVFHDEECGAKRGTNDINILDINGFKVCHMGDLGHNLSDEQINEIGEVDIAFIPVGGVYTIASETALSILERIKAKIIIPMHYKTEKTTFELETEEDFTRITRRHHQVINLYMDTINFTRTELDNINYDEKITYVLKTK